MIIVVECKIHHVKIKISFSSNNAITASCEETEQYSQRICLRIDGLPSVDMETSSYVLEKVEEICAESNLEIPDSNLDRAHQIGKPYFDKIMKVKCKNIIVCFNTFCHRTLLYRVKKNL